MSLLFIAGPSGSGKSHYVNKKIIDESLAAPNELFYFIVPEQFTMEAQKSLAKLHPSNSLINIDVLSFNRLAYRIFDETGFSKIPVLEDSGKILVLQKVINEVKDSLKVMKGALGKSGAAARLNSMLSEMIQYRVDPNKINIEDACIPELLKAKIEDIRLINMHFFEYIESKYLTVEEMPEVLSRVISKYEPLKNATIVFDGFTGFIPAQLLIIEKLLVMCKKVIVTVTVDKKAKLDTASSISNLFHMSHLMVKKLTEAAKKAQVEVLPEIWINHGENSRFAGNNELLFLENQLFRYEFKTYREKQESIFIGQAGNFRGEVESAAENILNLVRTKKYRYRDFAFVTGDIEQFGQIAESVFEANDIPCFLDMKQSVKGNPAVRFVCAAVEMAFEDFSYKSVFRWLKTGLTELSKEEIYALENYVLAAGIRGFSKYNSIWERTFSTIDDEEAQKINVVREKFIENIGQFVSNFKARMGSVKTRTKALYELIAKNKIEEKCKAYEEKFRENGDLARAGEYSQIYKAIMDLFDKFVEIMGDERVSLELYKQLIMAAFDDIRLGLVPLKQDQVLIGDIERSRLSNIKVMFFAGLNDGIIPRSGSETGVLSDNERALLSKMDISLAPDSKERMYQQRLYLYMSLARPSKKLYISYSRTDMSSNAALPSYLIKEIRDMFPLIEIVDLELRSVLSRIETRGGRNNALAKAYEEIAEKKPSTETLEIISRYIKHADTRKFVELLTCAALTRCTDTKIDSSFAKKLYGTNCAYSPSRVEMFGQCHFKHFLNYALRLKERDIFDFTPADIGSVLHVAISLFSKEMKKISWKDLTDAERNLAADEAFRKAYESKISTKNSISRKFDLLRLGSVNRRTVKSIIEQAKAGSFTPELFEEEFMLDGIRGIIDRVDACRKNGVNYIRIIDYKSGNRDFDLNDLYAGTQIQLPLYMIAAREIERIKKGTVAEPAGLYYYNMHDPLEEVKSLEELSESETDISKLKLNGVSIDDVEVLKLMDSSLQPGKASLIIPVKLNKKGNKDGTEAFSKDSRVLKINDLYSIEKFTKKQIKKTRRLIEEGRADINPKKTPKNDSCQYCVFRGICKFDEKVPGYKKQLYPKLKDTDAMKIIINSLGDDTDEI